MEDLVGLFNFKLHVQNKVGNIAILVFLVEVAKNSIDLIENFLKLFIEMNKNVVSSVGSCTFHVL